jgi:hypothetical protein
MRHKITLEEIEEQTLSMVIASSASNKKKKDLRLLLRHGFILYIVRYFENGELKSVTKPLTCLNTAIRYYNDLDA